MTASALTLVPAPNPATQVESISARVRRLQAEARSMAHEHIEELAHALERVHRLAEEIADGGEAYPVGVRETSRRLIDETDARIQTIGAILHRTGH